MFSILIDITPTNLFPDYYHSKLQDTTENIAIPKRVYLTIWTINICPLTILHKALLNIIYQISILIIAIIIIIINSRSSMW